MKGWRRQIFFLFSILCLWCFSSCAEKKEVKTAKTKVISLGTGGEKQEEWRTQKRTWTYIPAIQADRMMELTKKEVTTSLYEEVEVVYELMRPNGLQEEIAEGINLFIDEIGQSLVEAVYGQYHYEQLYTEIAEEEAEAYQRVIKITGTLEYYGPYASLHFAAQPMLYHKTTQDYIYREDTDPYHQNIVYDMLQGKQAALSDLFIDKTDYMSLLNDRIWYYIQQGVYEEAGLEMKRAFTALSEKDIAFAFHHNFSDQYRPVLVLYAKKGTLFFPQEHGIFIWLEDLEHFMVCDPNDFFAAVKNPEYLVKALINRDTIVLMEEDTSIQNPGYETTAFLKIQEYENKVVQGKINECLLGLEQEFAMQGDMLAALETHAQGSFSGVTGYEVCGQFFIITLKTYVMTQEGVIHTRTHFYTFNLANGELLSVKDLLLPDVFGRLTEEQRANLENTNFSINALGEIHAFLDTDDTWITYPADMFSFHSYASF